MCVGGVMSYLPHALVGDRLSIMTDFLLSSVIGGIAYVATLYKLKQLRGDL